MDFKSQKAFRFKLDFIVEPLNILVFITVKKIKISKQYFPPKLKKLNFIFQPLYIKKKITVVNSLNKLYKRFATLH